MSILESGCPGALASCLALAALLTACTKAPPLVRAEPTPSHSERVPRGVEAPAAPTQPSSPSPPQPAARAERILVPGDRPAVVVRAHDGRPPLAVFMGGLCSNVLGYIAAFERAAHAQGGVVAIDGDQPCAGSPGYHSYSWDAARQHARIEAAIAAAGLCAVPPDGLTVIGYSQGAALAEQLAQRWPDRYSRIVLIGAPTDPSPRSFAKTRAVVTMSCSRDVPARMRDAARAIARTGVPTTYVEMPGCAHGQVADAEATFGSVFTWLADHGRERPSVGAAAVPLLGPADGAGG